MSLMNSGSAAALGSEKFAFEIDSPGAALAPERGHLTQSSQSGLPLMLRDGRPLRRHHLRAKTFSLAVKRVMDIAGSAGLLVLASPILLGAAVAVKATSRGPVLFAQPRHGFLGRTITVYKFRTLYHEVSDKAGTRQVVGNDNRITAVGRFLRRTSIDELPQLFNILKGEMSLVGPRPHPIGMYAGGMRYEELVPYYHMRHLAKPGLTGWAQANGLRGPTVDPAVAHARIDHDIAYIQNFSLWLDIKTLWRTAIREVWRQGGS